MAEYIEREAAFEHLCRMSNYQICGSLREWINSIPTADVQPVVHGKWMYLSMNDMFHCTICNVAMVRNTFAYCPNCGAKMDGGT